MAAYLSQLESCVFLNTPLDKKTRAVLSKRGKEPKHMVLVLVSATLSPFGTGETGWNLTLKTGFERCSLTLCSNACSGAGGLD
jgi:hypothetical protein